MPFDPARPHDGTKIVAAELRDQLTGLHDEIAAIPAGPPGPAGPPFASVMVDGVATLPAGNPATVSAVLDGSVVRFTFSFPEGPQGQPGEVSNAQLQAELGGNLASALAASSGNSNSVAFLNGNESLADVITGFNALLAALRR